MDPHHATLTTSLTLTPVSGPTWRYIKILEACAIPGKNLD